MILVSNGVVHTASGYVAKIRDVPCQTVSGRVGQWFGRAAPCQAGPAPNPHFCWPDPSLQSARPGRDMLDHVEPCQHHTSCAAQVWAASHCPWYFEVIRLLQKPIIVRHSSIIVRRSDMRLPQGTFSNSFPYCLRACKDRTVRWPSCNPRAITSCPSVCRLEEFLKQGYRLRLICNWLQQV